MHNAPKKSLGQNFLTDKNIQRKIIDACDCCGQETVLEIGAGRGELTELLASRVKKVYAFEIDEHLCGMLNQRLKNFGNVEVVHKDVLTLDIRKFVSADGATKVIGNIPYYITTPLIEKVITLGSSIEAVYFTVQKEFGERIAAPAGSKTYGSFSCFVQYYTVPRVLFTVKKTCFWPVPGVDSCFLRLACRKEFDLSSKSETRLFKVIRTAFNQRRKTLRNSLKGLVAGQKLSLFFSRYGIDRNIRPEALTLEDFVNLSTM